MVAIALAVQLGQQPELAAHNLLSSIPVVALGAVLGGWFLRPSAGLAMGAAMASGMATLGVAQSGSGHTDELLLLAIPLSAAAAIVVGHCRKWQGVTAGMMTVIAVGLAIGIGFSALPVPFAIVHAAVIISLPTVPLR